MKCIVNPVPSRARLLVMVAVVLAVVLGPSVASAQFFTIGPTGTPGFITDAVCVGQAPSTIALALTGLAICSVHLLRR